MYDCSRYRWRGATIHIKFWVDRGRPVRLLHNDVAVAFWVILLNSVELWIVHCNVKECERNTYLRSQPPLILPDGKRVQVGSKKNICAEPVVPRRLPVTL